MKNKDEWTYKNELAEDGGMDPRGQLEEFVFGNFPLITKIKKEHIFKVHRLSGMDEREMIQEFVETNYPYEILKMCFNSAHLHDLAERDYKISKAEGHSDNEIIEELVFRMGFKKEVKPIGLTQFRQEYEPKLEKVRNNTQLELTDIYGFLTEMTQEMQDLMDTLFLFHSGALRERFKGSNDNETYEKLDELSKLSNDYKDDKKQLGHYVLYLNKLMKMFENYVAPLKTHQIGALGLFVVFRNLISKSVDDLHWVQNKSNADNSLKMLNNTHNEWMEIWNKVVVAKADNTPFPKYDMFQRMVVFFQEFLNVLVKDRIYPRVIVMQYHKFDMYGSHTIHAIDDTGEQASFVYKTFNPFTQYYYQARTNPISISPHLVIKDDLETWAIPPGENTENQEET